MLQQSVSHHVLAALQVCHVADQTLIRQYALLAHKAWRTLHTVSCVQQVMSAMHQMSYPPCVSQDSMQAMVV